MQKITIESEHRDISEPSYNELQYTAHANEYMAGNPFGLRGGMTPVERVEQFKRILPPGRIVLEIGPGPGHDALELTKAGYEYFGGDVARPFITHLKEMGLRAVRFDARVDKIPPGADGIFAHISLHHIPPKELAMLLASAREGLEGEKAIFISVVEGLGHERGNRTGGFSRDWFYYTPERLVQILEQEGVKIEYLQRVKASNDTPTIHAGGNFKKDYKSGSYGALELDPYGDVYYSLEALYPDNLVHSLIDAQAEAGLIPSNTGDCIKAAETAYDRGLIDDVALNADSNQIWAKGSAGRSINELTDHAEEFILANLDHFKPSLTTALAVCNNNGFSNFIVGYTPAWLLRIIRKHFNINGFRTADWLTDPDGIITGKVSYLIKAEGPKSQITRHQNYLRHWLGSKYPRVTIGIGASVRDRDADFMAITDYPIFTSAPKYTGGSIPWERWPVCDDPAALVDYLNMVTSSQNRIQL